MSVATPEKGVTTLASVETSKLIVRQPAKLAELSKLLETFDNLNARVGERMGEDRSGDWSGAGTGAGAGAGSGSGKGDDDDVSPREKAIREIPAPALVRERLEQHIEKEVHRLERQAKALARSGKPGAAYHLNELYAKIRKLNSLFGKLVELAEDVLKRFFIRVFIDKQPIL
jgi:hypothetical protein